MWCKNFRWINFLVIYEDFCVYFGKIISNQVSIFSTKIWSVSSVYELPSFVWWLQIICIYKWYKITAYVAYSIQIIHTKPVIEAFNYSFRTIIDMIEKFCVCLCVALIDSLISFIAVCFLLVMQYVRNCVSYQKLIESVWHNFRFCF